jgi:hypothetical protein
MVGKLLPNEFSSKLIVMQLLAQHLAAYTFEIKPLLQAMCM